MNSPLTAVVVLFGAALAVAWLMRVLRAPAILGFIVAGMALGPCGLNLIADEAERHNVEFFAEIGLVLLLFTVGLELSPAPLLRVGKRLLLVASVQIVATTLVTATILSLTGVLAGWGASIAGLAVSLSSTAIVLKHLSDRGETDTPYGTLATGVLLIQDVVVVLMLILLPLLAGVAGASWTAVTWRAALALGGLIGVTLLARLLMPALVNVVFRAGGRELTTLFAIVMACLGAWLASLANWSWPLGSFIAGLLLAQTDLRHQLHAEIMPFREAFNALFFISIGMLVDLNVVAAHAGGLACAIAITLVGKAALTGLAVVSGGWPLRLAVMGGIGLCTVSEFGYVLAREATRLEPPFLPAAFLPLFVAWAVGTMLVGAVFVPAAVPLGAALTRRLQPHKKTESPGPAAAPSAGHVVIVGYGINGRNLATVLKATRIPYAIVEMNRSNAHQGEADGVKVIVGDATRLQILEHAGLSAARALVVSIADQYATRQIVAQARAAHRDLYILARTRYLTEVEPLYALGADEVIPEEFETSIEIFAHVLREFGIPDNVIAQQIKFTRAGHYGMLRGRTAADRHIRAEWLQMLEAAVTQTFLLLEGSPACGRTIRELDLRSRTGVTIVAVTRAGQPTPSPAPDFQLATGDVLVLVGKHAQLDEARRALTPPVAEA